MRTLIKRPHNILHPSLRAPDRVRGSPVFNLTTALFFLDRFTLFAMTRVRDLREYQTSMRAMSCRRRRNPEKFQTRGVFSGSLHCVRDDEGGYIGTHSKPASLRAAESRAAIQSRSHSSARHCDEPQAKTQSRKIQTRGVFSGSLHCVRDDAGEGFA
jgi:hypothetical protein